MKVNKLLLILSFPILLAVAWHLLNRNSYYESESEIAVVKTPDQLWEEQGFSTKKTDSENETTSDSKNNNELTKYKVDNISNENMSALKNDIDTFENVNEYFEPPSETLVDVVTPEDEAAEALVEPIQPYNGQDPINSDLP
jgi:hypothetical protein